MAARRHQVENLVLRGTVFYWRPRIPVRFAAARSATRLSLSLRLSDRKKAAWVARRLNALLHEIELRPAARMTTKEQLTKIFALEIEATRDELERLDIAARRTGSRDDPGHREADRQVGWAYRLLEAYGAVEEISFEPGAEGREALVDAGVDHEDIPAIAATYLSERQGARRAPFIGQVLHRMAQVGLADNTVNREAASEQIYRARAEALLGSASTPRLNRLLRREEESRPERVAAFAVPPAPSPSLLWEADDAPAAGLPEPAPVQAAVSHLPPAFAVPAPAPVAQLASQDAAAPADQAKTASARAPSDLPLGEFDAAAKDLVDNKQNEWEPDTAADLLVLVRIFKGILEEHGVTHSGEITQAHVAALRQHFNHILTNWGRSSRLRELSPKELREETARRVEAAKEKGEQPPKVGLGSATIRRHLGNLDHFLNHLKDSHHALGEWSFKGLRPRKPPKGATRRQQVKPKPQQIRPMYDLPMFTGRLDDKNPDLSGEIVIHDSLYFLPMMFTYLGSRRKEFAGLQPDDIELTENGWAIHIHGNALRRIKNIQSERYLPIPDELLRLNFLDYVERIRDLGHTQLFPELFSPYREEQDPGDRFYKNFMPILKAAPSMANGLWKRTIHALRHGFADTLYQSGVSEAVIEDIAGRLGEGETATRYTDPAGLPLVRDVISRYPVITGHLEPQPIRLLRWVEAKQAPPWAGRKKADRFGRTPAKSRSSSPEA